MENKSIGFELKSLNNLIARKILKENNGSIISPVQIKVIHYLMEHLDETIYQRDIEKNIMVRRSTMSGILNTMEKHGLIKKVDSKDDARLKEIIVSSKTIQMANEFKEKMLSLDCLLNKNINEKDKEIFFKVIDQIKENLKD